MLEELQRRNYSPSTSRGYILAVKQFAEYFNKSPEQLGAEDVRRFQLYLLNEKKLASGTVEMRMSALRFLYKKTLKRRDIWTRRSHLSQDSPEAAGDLEYGRGDAADRGSVELAASYDSDGSLRNGHSPQ
jgi:site-specific recombinase XerD